MEIDHFIYEPLVTFTFYLHLKIFSQQDSITLCIHSIAGLHSLIFYLFAEDKKSETSEINKTDSFEMVRFLQFSP